MLKSHCHDTFSPAACGPLPHCRPAIFRHAISRHTISRHASRGFSLVELMVVVAIAAVLAAVGGPALFDMIAASRLTAASSALQVSLNLARAEAVRRGSNSLVTVAALTTAGSWSNGWVVFVDTGRDANSGVGPADDTHGTRLEIADALAPAVTYSQGATDTLNYFSYNGQGGIVTSSGAIANRVVWFSGTGTDKYCVIISSSGRVRTARAASAAACPTN